MTETRAGDATSPHWYEAPRSLDLGPPVNGQQSVPVWADLRGLLRTWERLRLAFDAVLAAEVLAMVLWREPSLLGRDTTYPYLFIGFLLANACFFAGPLADAYARWVGLRARLMTYGIFAAGTALAMVLAALYVSDLFRLS